MAEGNKYKIIHKRSNQMVDNLPKAPTSGVLEKGEIAVNYNNNDPCLFIEKDNGSIVKFSSSEVITDFVTGITSTKLDTSAFNTHTANTTVHITSSERTNWNNKYAKPSTGIPKTDLASDVQTSLGKADSAIQNIHTINRASITGTGDTTLVGSVYMNNMVKSPNSGTSNTGRVDLGTVATSIYMNGSAYTPTTTSTNNGRVNLGAVATSIYTNGTNYTPNSGSTNRGRVTLPDYYNKTEIDSEVQNINANIESKVSAEATARQNADNTKQNKLTDATGYSSSGNRVLVSLNGAIQWAPFNNILAGSTTPISSDGNNGDLYIQTD